MLRLPFHPISLCLTNILFSSKLLEEVGYVNNSTPSVLWPSLVPSTCVCVCLPFSYWMRTNDRLSFHEIPKLLLLVSIGQHPKSRTLSPPCKGREAKPWQFVVFRFFIEYSSSLRDFGPLGNNNRSIFISGFLKDDILALSWNLRLVIELWYLERFWFLSEDFLKIILFLHGEIYEFS